MRPDLPVSSHGIRCGWSQSRHSVYERLDRVTPSILDDLGLPVVVDEVDGRQLRERHVVESYRSHGGRRWVVSGAGSSEVVERHPDAIPCAELRKNPSPFLVRKDTEYLASFLRL